MAITYKDRFGTLKRFFFLFRLSISTFKHKKVLYIVKNVLKVPLIDVLNSQLSKTKNPPQKIIQMCMVKSVRFSI